jgi:hypothetical protein
VLPALGRNVDARAMGLTIGITGREDLQAYASLLWKLDLRPVSVVV